MSGIDATGNPPRYDVASRSAAGTMEPQSPWDSPAVRGKVYVIEYDLRTHLTPNGSPATYDWLQNAEQTADL